MAKVHTRVKRRHGISSNLDGNMFLKKKPKENRSRTFPSIDSAKDWAAKNDLAPESYTFKPVKRNRRIELLKKE